MHSPGRGIKPRDLTYSSTCGTRVRTWAVFGGTRTCTWIFVVLVLEFQILFEYFGKMICPVDVRDANKSLEFLYFLKTYIYLNLKFHQLKYTSTFCPTLPYSSLQHGICVQSMRSSTPRRTKWKTFGLGLLAVWDWGVCLWDPKMHASWKSCIGIWSSVVSIELKKRRKIKKYI